MDDGVDGERWGARSTKQTHMNLHASVAVLQGCCDKVERATRPTAEAMRVACPDAEADTEKSGVKAELAGQRRPAGRQSDRPRHG
jgi:hypothetical protein